MSEGGPEVKIERAKGIDAESIQALYHQLVGDDPNIRVLFGQIEQLNASDSNILLVARFDHQVAATGLLTICEDAMYAGKPFAIVENIVVDNNLRGRKIGTLLMNEIKRLCKALRCTKIVLLSSSKRVEAHRFFEKCGYLSDEKRGFVNYINRQ